MPLRPGVDGIEPTHPADSFADWLFEEEEIAVRSGAHCAPLMHETLGTKMQGAVRISVSHKNTEEEIDRTANAIKKLSQLLE